LLSKDAQAYYLPVRARDRFLSKNLGCGTPFGFMELDPGEELKERWRRKRRRLDDATAFTVAEFFW